MNEPLAMHAFRVGDQVVVKGWPPSNVLEVTRVTVRC